MQTGIGLLGGTFDPVHIGHVKIAQSFLKHPLIEQLWIIPAPDPPHKEEMPKTSFENRVRMLKGAFKNIEQVRIYEIENYLPRPSYTIQTVRYLKKKYPDNIYYLCIGEDSLVEFHTWYNYPELVNECELLVARRPGSSTSGVEDAILQKTHFVDHQPVDISSTEIRNKLARGESVESLVPDEVLDIIDQAELYRN